MMQLNGKMETIKIGVLAIQGAFSEHAIAFQRYAQLSGTVIEVKEIRSVEDIINDFDGIILPGGESTTVGHMLRNNGFGEQLKALICGTNVDKPPIVWGTCSGLIMLANNLQNQKTGGQYVIGGLDVTVSRNFFGRQINSFEAPVSLNGDVFEESTCHGVFIRAPAIVSCDNAQVKTLAVVTSKNHSEQPVIVAVEQGNILATSFHPELTEDTLWQKHFIEMIVANKSTQK